ncbi:PP2C family protein-serine/threonine phosphatase [Thetidibacter halocola]|uniref:Serine/threonine-protein phosphatase n=1 Tax=Thetidibacter halocola TaxID=2827239 RepID=A0A8J7W9T7_9RHOB|nr:protein phosphatase 2C domain-containing protein [Thetidibacter halocola]MBS0123545.1 serine/threonine-protein phosphatase [Thetidibacter halocola]
MQLNDCFTFETGQATDVGCRREINEDSFLSRPDWGLWAVADGMGGHAAGDFASQTIVEELHSIGMSGSPDDQLARFHHRLARANQLILDHAATLGRGTIGATLVALLIHGDEYACLWSGDSRIYLLRDGRLRQVTRDHTELRALLDAGTITEQEARNWPRRNVITRAIGVSPHPHCDTVTGTLELDDRFVLCSDGLTEHLEDHEIAEFVGSLAPRAACHAMIDETLRRGARDNVTVVVVRMTPPPPPEDEDFPPEDTLTIEATLPDMTVESAQADPAGTDGAGDDGVADGPAEDEKA